MSVVLILGAFKDVNVIFTNVRVYLGADLPPASLVLGVERLRFGRSMGGRSCC